MNNEQAVAHIIRNNISCIIFDIDGVMTDGSIVVDSTGKELFKTFNVKDGLGIQMLSKAGYHLGIITGRDSVIVTSRAKVLGIQHVFQGRLEKTEAFEELINSLGITDQEVAYMGDDVPDVPLLKRVGFSACPADAHSSAKLTAMWHSNFAGGRGAVREFADLFLVAQEKKIA